MIMQLVESCGHKKEKNMTFAINKHISWVGEVDWELIALHGKEYSTHRGSTYNSCAKERRIKIAAARFRFVY